MNSNYKPIITYIFIGICIIYCAIIHILPLDNEMVSAILVGAFYKPFVLAGEYWRLLTTGFIHIQITHLLVNMMSTFYLGGTMEKLLGHKKYIIGFILSILGGSLFVLALGQNTVTVGISGGLYGLLAIYTYYLYSIGGFKIPQIRNNMLRMFAINLIINFLPNISVAGHLGGFIVGWLYAMYVIPNDKVQISKINIAFASILLVVSLVFLTNRNKDIPEDQRYYLTDFALLQYEQDLGFKNHAMKIAKNLDKIYALDHDFENLMKGETEDD